MEKIISYADNHEDVLLRRLFPDQASGFYLDVGAYDPTCHSVTKHFYDRGWRGINIEPDPIPFAKLVAERPDEVNLNIALSDRQESLRVYAAESAAHLSVEPGLLTGWFGAPADELVEQYVPALSLADVCDRHVPEGRTIDFLKIDVEGHEAAVIRGGDWRRWRPRILVVEAHQPESWEPILLGADYHFALFDGVNRVYVRGEDCADLKHVASVPVNIMDNYLSFHHVRQIEELHSKIATYNRVIEKLTGVVRSLVGEQSCRALKAWAKRSLNWIAT